MDEHKLIKLNHEFAKGSNFNLTEKLDDAPYLIPLPLDLVNSAVHNTFSEFKKEHEKELTIVFSAQDKSDYQMMINLQPLKERFPNSSFDQISDRVSNEINLKIQKTIIKLLKDQNLNFKEYDRSRVFFEYSVTNDVMTIIWVKKTKISKEDL